MNSLEFIEKEIAYYKELLERLEKLKVTSNKYELQLNRALYKNAQEKLNYSQQIKTELEAWESVKSYLVDLGNVYVLAICNDDKEYLTLKKALEVKE